MPNEEKHISEKKFLTRNSVLTDFWINDRTPFHLALLAFLIFLINRVAKNYFKNEEINLGLQHIVTGFTNIHLALIGWATLLFMSLAVYYFFILWARLRLRFPENVKLKQFGILWIAMLILHYAMWFYLPPYFISNFKLLPPLAFALLMEHCRLVMKAHSFLRENTPKILNYKPHSEKEMNLPTFRHYLYFLFAPALIYMDEYPRTPKIRLNYLLFYFVEILGIMYLLSLLFDTFLLPAVKDFDCVKYTKSLVLLLILENCFLAILAFFLVHVIIFHSTQNLFAELLRFGDRLFYSDWWTATSTVDFHRKWNIVVGKWLYTYVYKESRELGIGVQLAKVLVFVISTIGHEWVLRYTFGFNSLFYSSLYMVGLVFYYLPFPKKPLFNVLLLYIMALAISILGTFYGIEYYGQIGDSIENQLERNTFVPKFCTRF